jgi:hypothetical protein
VRRFLTERLVPQRYDAGSFVRLLREYSEELTRLTTYAGTTTWDPGSIANGGNATTTVTVPGALTGVLHSVRVFAPISLQGLQATGYVSADETVTIVLSNTTGGAVDLASAEWGVVVENMVRTA